MLVQDLVLERVGASDRDGLDEDLEGRWVVAMGVAEGTLLTP